MSGEYDIMQVCLNGHLITDTYSRTPEHRMDHCDKCGEKTIFRCPKCNTNIRGEFYVPHAYSASVTSVPEFCHKCGNAYPWKDSNKKKNKDINQNPLIVLENLFNKFHSIARQIRIRYNNRQSIDINDEYDVQDLLHALLFMHFDDIRPEEWTPSYAGGSARIDFLLKNEKILIEVKKSRKGLGAKELGDQLIIDIEKYHKHPDCKYLFCFVYDPEERISNPKGIEKDLSKEENGINVKVIIVSR